MQENKYSDSSYFALFGIWPILFIGLMFGVLSGCAENSKQDKTFHESVSEKRIIVELPKIGEIITTDRALELCAHYGFNHLVKRIEENSYLFKQWKFDGCSMTSDVVLSKLIKIATLTEICLRHDLGYAYGEPGNEKERMEIDRKFQNELLSAGANDFTAKAMYDAVRVGGKEKFCFSFTWGFARVEPCRLGIGFKLKE